MGEEVFDHHIEHGMHAIIGHGVKHLFAAPVGFEDPGRAQEPQMVAGQRASRQRGREHQRKSRTQGQPREWGCSRTAGSGEGYRQGPGRQSEGGGWGPGQRIGGESVANGGKVWS